MTKKARRRLTDLYVVGKEVTFDDGAGEPITIWVQKLNPVDTSTAMKRANGERARVLSLKHHTDTDEYLAIRVDVEGMASEREGLIEYLIAEDMAKHLQSKEAELAAEDEWAKENYLEGLREAWENGLEDKWLVDPDDEEANRVRLEIKRFADTVVEQSDDHKDFLKAAYEDYTTEKLVDLVTDRMIEIQADMAWMKEFRRCEVWFCVRDPENHRDYYFENRDEVDALPLEVLQRIQDEYASLSVETLEGKDSQDDQSS